MDKPYFSIIVPVYNVEKYLSQCVKSIVRQTYTNFEVILVDDGAKDKSGEICDQFAKNDERIKVIHKKNGGLSSARNSGIKKASGKYIIFVDSDDYWSNNSMLQQISSYLGEKEELAIWKYSRCAENEFQCNDGEEAKVQEYSLSADYKMLISKGMLFASAWYEAIPRTWFLRHNLFFEEGVVAEDIEWFGRLLECTTHIIYFKFPFYVYRNRCGSISNSITQKKVLDIEGHLDKLQKYQQSDPQQWRLCYIGEQSANFAIVLSRNVSPEVDIKQYMRFFSFLKNAVRNRSKVIYLLYKMLGSKRMLSILKKVKRL